MSFFDWGAGIRIYLSWMEITRLWKWVGCLDSRRETRIVHSVVASLPFWLVDYCFLERHSSDSRGALGGLAAENFITVSYLIRSTISITKTSSSCFFPHQSCHSSRGKRGELHFWESVVSMRQWRDRAPVEPHGEFPFIRALISPFFCGELTFEAC
jgi:hypothetical protein